MKTRLPGHVNRPFAHLIAGCVLLVSVLLYSGHAAAQCIAAPAPVSCAVPGATPLANGDNITAGITKVVTGTSTFSGITLNGGTLIVCGTLNLSNITFTSGTIYVTAGATLNVNVSTSVVFGSNCTIYNFGTIYFGGSIVTGSNNLIMNCVSTAFFNIPFNQFVLQGPNTTFVNYGMFNSSFFIVQSTNSPNPVCSGAGSVITTGIMINQFSNAFTSPSGESCIQITNQIINSQPMTATPNVNICYIAGSVSISGSPNFGSATVNNNCPSCSVALPVGITDVSGDCYNSSISLRWVTQQEEDCSTYKIQLSADGIEFIDAADVPCQGTGNTAQEYYCELPNGSVTALDYVRVKRTDLNGNSDYSNAIALDCSVGSQVDIYPTFLVDPFITVKSNERIIAIVLYGMDGRIVRSFDIDQDQKKVLLNVGEDTAVGQYLLHIETENTRVDKLLKIM